MDIELELKKMLDFIYACNADSNHEKDLSNQTLVAENYLKRLKAIDKNGFDKIIRDIENKLKLIISRNTEKPPAFTYIPGMQIRISSHFLNENGQYPYFV